ncbi:integral membrane sensor hybrid histidine kinase [Caballeronia glebae]|uniref:histidine kinase n=1 Tax=Caballeronia glebae TaxID=1777143 RepID=A0A158CWW2_9BURK|nr:hybrid sensor histidine kinase/response regulator [Caballeronia glebae]SAK86828.1 integral membrane sensor hybrid histidine kinase [Caballeronia glebae]
MVLLAILVASIVLPTACISLYAYFDYQRRQADALDTVARLVRVAEENAVKVLDLNTEMSSRIVEILGDLDETATREQQATLHARLNAMAGRLPQVAAVSVFSADGDLVANSRWYPAPDISILQRADFQAARDHRPTTYFSLPMFGAVAQTDVFNTATSRTGSNGEFLGVVAVALRRAYFRDFYRQLVGNNPDLTVGLYRSDANLLVRYPEAGDGIVIPADNPFVSIFRQKLQQGHVRTTSAIDGRDKTVAFRKLADYPLYVTVSFDVSSVFAGWWRHDLLVALLALVPCTGIWLLVGFSLYRLKLEQVAWESWKSEAALREDAEATTRQLRRIGALGNLVASVAHDFNNLLMVVFSNMELARQKGFSGVQAEVQAVEHAAGTASELSRKLLSVARKKPLQKQRIGVQEWLIDTMPLVRAAAGPRVSGSLEAPDGLWDIVIDKAELESSLINIAVNARDAMPEGGEFTVRCQNVSVPEGETVPAGDYVVMTCSDDGVGMRDTVVQRAFETLFTTKEAGSGTGLGLAQVLATCEQAGGTARLRSEPGKGTDVSLYLPRADAPEIALAPTVATSLGVQESKPLHSVLLVEDNEEVAAGLAAVLQLLGYEVSCATSGDNALAVLQQGRMFDLILSDVQMPGARNGFDLAELVKRESPSQLVVLMTGYAGELERGKQLGVPVLLKPFSPTDLESLMSGTVLSDSE